MKYFLLILGLALACFAGAQQKQFTLEDAVLGRYAWLKPAELEQLSWRSNQTFTFVTRDTLREQPVSGAPLPPVLSLAEINAYLGTNGQKALRSFPAHEWLSPDRLLLKSGKLFWEFLPSQKKFSNLIQIPENAANALYCPAASQVAFTADNNLLLAVSGSEVVPVTRDGGNGIVNGQAVHRHEFGINKGIFWSPDGNLLAFYRMDESMVKDYPLVDYMARQAEHKPVKYPMAGMTSHEVKVGIYNLQTGQTIFLKTGAPADHYLTNPAWSPDEKQLFLIELNRGQNHTKLNVYDVATGEKTATLWEEKNEKYVEPMYPIRFSKTRAGQFYYQSRKDGWFHVYLYDAGGKLLRQITRGPWEVTSILGFDSAEKYLFVEATRESPVERHLYRVEIKSGKMERLTPGDGVHSGLLSPGGDYLLVNRSSSSVPQVTDLLTASGKKIRNLLTADDPLKGFELGENNIFTIKAADDSTDLWCRMIKPANFNPSQKYPVIVYVYGGPHAQLVNRTWTNDSRWWEYYMASKGFVVFIVDNRGSANRGSHFEQSVFRSLGITETADQLKGIAYLKKLPFVDASRIGVHGWSYGGFMTLNLMLRHPETFKVGVAGGPVVDWSMYEVMYGERYMDTPQENPDGYRETSMLNHVKNLSGKLMLIHGVQDETVVMQHSMKFLEECIKQGKQVDFFVYPTHEHNVRGKDRVHLMEKISRYFLENL